MTPKLPIFPAGVEPSLAQAFEDVSNVLGPAEALRLLSRQRPDQAAEILILGVIRTADTPCPDWTGLLMAVQVVMGKGNHYRLGRPVEGTAEATTPGDGKL